MTDLNWIKNLPTSMMRCHESLLRSYQILELVKEMLKRKDSHETILMIINDIENSKSGEAIVIDKNGHMIK
jgi:hypothetical protein